MRGYRPSKDPKGGEFFTSDVTDMPQDWDWRLQGVFYIVLGDTENNGIQ